MGQHKLTIHENAFEKVVAYDPERVVTAVWFEGHTRLRLWFGGSEKAYIELADGIAQAAWEELADLEREDRNVRDR